VAGAEVDRFADFFVQFLHVGQGDFADVDPRFDDVAEFEQADAEPVGAGVLGALDKARAALIAARMRCAVDGCRPVCLSASCLRLAAIRGGRRGRRAASSCAR
jgi:hypothetical protein